MKHTLRILAFVLSGLSFSIISAQTVGGKNLNEGSTTAQNIEIDYDYTISQLTVNYQFTPSCSSQDVKVRWDLNGKIVEGKHQFEHTYKELGDYETCLFIQITEDTFAKKCKSVRVGDPELCDGIVEPVCGCDNQTYTNACYAEKLYGVYTWTPGPCLEIVQSLIAEYAFDFIGGYKIAFINTSIGNYDRWQWDFGDGNVSESRNPEHTFKVGGKYATCLTVSSKTTTLEDVFCDTIVLNQNFQFVDPVHDDLKD